MTFLVTGAAGFIGSHVCRDLLGRGAEVRALTRHGGGHDRLADVSSRLEWVSCDLLSAPPSELDAVARGIDACIHLAWDVLPGGYLTSPGNVRYREASLRLFSSLASQRCRRITGVGTCFEYATAPHPLGEQSPLDPLTPYAKEKLATFRAADEALRGSGTALTWARLFYLFGPWENARRLVPDVVVKLLNGEHAAVTAGRQIRDFLHVADAARALTAVTLSSACGPVNIGSGEPVRVIDIVMAIGAITGRADLIDVGARADNLVDPPYVCADNRRLLEATDWRREYTLTSGLEDTVAWWRGRLASCGH